MKKCKYSLPNFLVFSEPSASPLFSREQSLYPSFTERTNILAS
jgi:hypothetical protein